MITVRGEQMAAMAKERPNQQMVTPCPDTQTWIEIRLLDDNDQPVAGAAYRVVLPDSSIQEGVLDTSGRARYERIVPGSCIVSFPEIDAREWRTT
jgi:hypothetical protein